MSTDQQQLINLSLPGVPRFKARVLAGRADRVLAALEKTTAGKKFPELRPRKTERDKRDADAASLATAICNTILGTERFRPHEISDTPQPMTDHHLEIMRRLRDCPHSALPVHARDFARSSMLRGMHIFQPDPVDPVEEILS